MANQEVTLMKGNEAIALDPESPAVTAKEMLDSIMSFYCKDYYNP